MIDEKELELIIRKVVKEAINEAMRNHLCKFNEEEMADLKNLAFGTKIFKRSIWVMIVGFLLAGITFGIQGVKNLINLSK